jgi:hypothetical protein
LEFLGAWTQILDGFFAASANEIGNAKMQARAQRVQLVAVG